MLELKKIKKSYKMGETSQVVLKGIDVNFKKNEFTSILGKSGSGKTTLLNIIGGLDKYDSGDLIIDGTSTKKYDDRQWDSYRNYRVGFIFQNYNLIAHQTVLSNVEMSLTLSGASKQERRKRAIEALNRVGLKEHISKKPSQLSGGQMQRVAIARAIVNNPEIILADEPTGALDSKTSVQIMDLLKEISKDKLVIMVTHNSEIAQKYSNRIIELKDGIITNDSNPFDGKEKKEKERKINKTSMSLRTSLALSFNNLLTKKGRTLLTAIAGSIGIIGIALILALTNGVNNYANSLEKDSLTEYPITIERTNYDLFGAIGTALKESSEQKECEKGKLCSKDDIIKETVVSSDKGLVQQNDIKAFKQYLDKNKKIDKYASDIVSIYNLELQVYTDNYLKVNPTDLKKEESNDLFKMIQKNSKNKYKILAGNMPKNTNELVLVVGKDNQIDDSILYALDFKDRSTIKTDLEKIHKDENYRVPETKYSYNQFLGKKYKLILNTDYYKEKDSKYIDFSNDEIHMKEKIDNGLDLEIVGVISEESASSPYIGYKGELQTQLINKISKTSIYDKQINNTYTNVLTGLPFDGVTNTYDNLTKTLGIYKLDEPSSLEIYPKDYDSKEKIIEMIDKYNEEKKASNQESQVIKYSDMMKSLVGGIKNVTGAVSALLIALVAISLVVSSIMIGIITYISVLERTKEIGVLRAIGASKKDIVRVFKAETIIEGAVAGLLGVIVAFLLCIPINIIVEKMAEISSIAKLPFGSAIILVLLSTALNVIAGTIPSKIAANKKPVEALRTE